MKQIYIIDEHISSKQNGVGTYMRQIGLCLNTVQVNFISFNSDRHKFTIYKDHNNHTFFCFPFCAQGAFINNGGLLLPILKLYIKDSSETAFFVNHFPCADFLRSFRHLFRRSKIVFTIHDQSWTAPFLGNSNLLKRLYKHQYIKKIYQRANVKRFYRIERDMYRLANLVVCLSSTTKCILENYYNVPQEKIILIPNAWKEDKLNYHSKLKQAESRSILGLDLNEHIFLYAGRTSKAKGINVLLKSFERVYLQNRNVRLIIAGEVFSLNEFTKLTPHSLSHIIYTGLISNDKLMQWYQAADVGVIPSYTEQCSFTGIEMMANGLIVVTSDGNGIGDMFRDYENALVAEIGDRENEEQFIRNLTNKMLAAISLPLHQEENMRNKAYETVREKFSIDKMRKGYQHLIDVLDSI